jgi:hypothetical protein
MKKNICLSTSGQLSKKEQKALKGGAGYKYVCVEGYICSNNLTWCNRICQQESGLNCINWNAPCP